MVNRKANHISFVPKSLDAQFEMVKVNMEDLFSSIALCIEVDILPEDNGSSDEDAWDEVVEENEEAGQPGFAEPLGRLGLADEDVAEDGNGDRDDSVHAKEEGVDDKNEHTEGGVLRAVGLFESDQ